MTTAVRPASAQLLVVADPREASRTAARWLRREGYRVVEAENGVQALEQLATASFDLLLSDLDLEPMDGLELLRRVQDLYPQLPVVVMAADGSSDRAVQALRNGAADCVGRPLPADALSIRVARALERQALQAELGVWAGEFGARFGPDKVIGRSASMRELLLRAARAARGDATVLVSGERGTGKELLAKRIHARSGRAARPFVAVNCTAVPATLLEAELFGYAPGAFAGATKSRRGLFEEAQGGTLFIDEIADTAEEFQAKLLRALQEGQIQRLGEHRRAPVDVRVIAATAKSLPAEVAAQRFRQDLFDRLRVVALEVPPLRQRREDIPLLAAFFVERHNLQSGARRQLTDAAVARLMGHDFPGNVRELKDAVEQAVALAERDRLAESDFPLSPPSAGLSSEPVASLALTIEGAEKRAIEGSLRRHSSDLLAVAQELRISSSTLWRKMRKFGVSVAGRRHFEGALVEPSPGALTEKAASEVGVEGARVADAVTEASPRSKVRTPQ